jgi:cysteine desulfurase
MIYLDHASTTSLDPRVLEAMYPYLTSTYGNASSVHAAGRRARGAIEEARETVASIIGAESSEIIFTSSGTEADALAIQGFMRCGGALLTSAVEHEAVLRPAERLHREGRAVILKPDDRGAVSPALVDEALSGRENVGLVSLMSANNEIGTLTDIPGVAAVCKQRGVTLHTDAVQTLGLHVFDVEALGVDMATGSAHKFYGPKGAGFLYVRGGTPIEPLIEGSQERKRRGGTENVAAIVGLAAALELAHREREARLSLASSLRTHLLSALAPLIREGAILVTPEEPSRAVPHVVNIAFPPIDGHPIDGEMLILNMDMEGVAVSAGSACTSGALEPSHVLLAAGYDRATSSAAVRFSTGTSTTAGEIDTAVQILTKVIERMRRLALL